MRQPFQTGFCSLRELCEQIIQQSPQLRPDEQRLRNRLVQPEYSPSDLEIKTFPLPLEQRLFIVCWSFHAGKLLQASMYPSPAPFHVRYEFRGEERTQLHTHDYIELGYIVDGSFCQRINNQDITFHEGEFVLIDKNCIHQDYMQEAPATILFFGIANNMFSEIMDENVTEQKIIAFLQSALLKQKDVQQFLLFRPTEGAVDSAEAILAELLRELYHNDLGSEYICKGLLLRLFRLLSTGFEFSLTREQRRTMGTIIFDEVLAYINANYATVTITDLMNRFHFQEDYFNRLIKGRTGYTYSGYLQKVRMEKAESLLLHTDRRIDEIAESVGYHNKGYFYKIFTERNGMTPAKYRRLNQT